VTTDELIEIGLNHLARFAFFTRDNPFLSSRAAIRLPAQHRAILTDLLDGTLDCEEWLSSGAADRLLKEIQVGCVPRTVQLVTKDGESKVGIADVHAFLRAPLFWWLTSILWCLQAGRALDPLLSDAIKGYRLHPGFIAEPSQRGLMFRDHKTSYRAWKSFARTTAQEYPGETLATNTIDLRDFYYSSTASPGKIVSRFLKSKGKRLRRGQVAHTLTLMLDALHARFAARCQDIKPRPHLAPESSPLPVGLPSSRILANFIVDLACEDLASMGAIDGVAAFADDVLLMTRVLPTVSETPVEYLSRLGLIPPEGTPSLNSPRANAVASLVVSLDKSYTSYSRSSNSEDEAEEEDGQDAHEDPGIDPYIEGNPDPDWGGRLRTVLRAPHRPERIPRELSRELEQLVDEIRVGLDAEEAEARLEKFVEEIDSGLFLALRPHWVDLLVAGIAAGGISFVEEISAHFVRLVSDLEPPPQSSHAMRQALRIGLRASWVQALSQALAVALGKAELENLTVAVPTLFEETTLGTLKTDEVVRYAQRLRERRLVPGMLVAVPLSEFTGWSGPLIGPGVFSAFMRWASAHSTAHKQAELLQTISQSVRFIQLHEICIALHLWIRESEEEERWLDDAFKILGRQPLVQLDQVSELADQATRCLNSGQRSLADAEETPSLRFALPSLPIDDRQLKASLEGNAPTLGEIAATARRRVRSVVGISAQRKADVLVLPEWSLPSEQLPWLMNRAASEKMLIVAGQAPTVEDGVYSNKIWTGIPIQDSAGHRECLVVPPRLKRFLSPEETGLIRQAKVKAAEVNGRVPVYDWRGIRFASLVCFEFADIATRTQLQTAADLLTVSSLNKDWRYFDAIQESTTRDNYCLTLCVNSGAFPGTKIMRPTTSAKAVAASVHGSDDPAVVSRKLDMHPIVTARIARQRPSEATTREPTDDTNLDDYSAYSPV